MKFINFFINLRSSSFFDLVIRECSLLMDPAKLRLEQLKANFESLTVVQKEELKTQYFYRATNEPIELEEQAHDFIVTPNGKRQRMGMTANGKQLIFNRVLSLNSRLFYLIEILFKEILEALSLEISEPDQWRMKLKISEYLMSVRKIE